VFNHHNRKPASPYLRGFSDDFSIPVSRWTENRRADLPADQGLEVLMESDEAGLCLINDPARRSLYMFNHIEYDTTSLADEYFRDLAAGKPIVKNKFPHQIVNNLFSHNSKVGENGYNEEEIKMVTETRKIFGDARIMVTATCVRVPVPRAHSEAINLEFEKPITPAEVKAILSKAPGVKIVDDPAANHFPMPLEASGQDLVLVGRIRQDISREDGRGIDMFVSGDQVRKGAATNAIQIAELVLKGDAGTSDRQRTREMA
jgi:hypothetical protein